jgi:hypothetical protein
MAKLQREDGCLIHLGRRDTESLAETVPRLLKVISRLQVELLDLTGPCGQE